MDIKYIFASLALARTGKVIDYLSVGQASLMVYGLAREAWDHETFKEWDERLEFEELKITDPEKAQNILNQQMLKD